MRRYWYDISLPSSFLLCFFFNDAATTEIYTLSLHDALPISVTRLFFFVAPSPRAHLELLARLSAALSRGGLRRLRSEEHTSELQSRPHLVCRLLLEKKKYIRFFSTKPSTLVLPLPIVLALEP